MFVYNSERGLLDSVLEGQILASPTTVQSLTAPSVILESAAQGASIVFLTSANESILLLLQLPAEAKARISTRVSKRANRGSPYASRNDQWPPDDSLARDQSQHRETIGVLQDGSHGLDSLLPTSFRSFGATITVQQLEFQVFQISIRVAGITILSLRTFETGPVARDGRAYRVDRECPE